MGRPQFSSAAPGLDFVSAKDFTESNVELGGVCAPVSGGLVTPINPGVAEKVGTYTDSLAGHFDKGDYPGLFFKWTINSHSGDEIRIRINGDNNFGFNIYPSGTIQTPGIGDFPTNIEFTHGVEHVIGVIYDEVTGLTHGYLDGNITEGEGHKDDDLVTGSVQMLSFQSVSVDMEIADLDETDVARVEILDADVYKWDSCKFQTDDNDQNIVDIEQYDGNDWSVSKSDVIRGTDVSTIPYGRIRYAFRNMESKSPIVRYAGFTVLR